MRNDQLKRITHQGCTTIGLVCPLALEALLDERAAQAAALAAHGRKKEEEGRERSSRNCLTTKITKKMSDPELEAIKAQRLAQMKVSHALLTRIINIVCCAFQLFFRVAAVKGSSRRRSSDNGSQPQLSVECSPPG